MARELSIREQPLPSWPGGASAAVSLTFDVDVDVELLGRRPDADQGALSEALFGVVRGVPRILALLAERDIPATFYVPGEVARRHPDVVRRIAAAGHEVAHHGFAHVPPARLSPSEQRRDLERGIEALNECIGARPLGYRAPGWEPTAETLRLLGELGFAYDSSLMHDDRPYLVSGIGSDLLELPVHWSLDDWALFGWEPGYQGTLSGVDSLAGIWGTELRSAVGEGRHLTYTMHPEVIGRAHRIEALRTLLDCAADAGVWFATHGHVARLYRS
jgi:peptidoglycan/xylan/chitin deacetylase (PgdA/CDA1 family)